MRWTTKHSVPSGIFFIGTFHTFETFAELDRFYKGGVQYINQCLNAGWARKDALDCEAYEAALEEMKPKE